MIAAGLGDRGSLDIPLDVWNANIPKRLIWDIRNWKSGPDCGRFDVWQPSLHTRRMIGVLVGDGFLCRDPGCLGAPEWEDLTDNVSAFVKPKNDVKCSFIIDMRNLNDCSKVPLRKVKLPSIHTVFQTIQREIHQGAPLWGITLDISNFYWSLQIPAEHRGLFRIQGAHFQCLPFGWKFPPVLAHDTLAALLREFFDNHAVGLDIHRFHYLDNVLILSRDRECMDSLGPQLGAFLTAKGLRISTKSCLKPHQNVLWLGKVFDSSAYSDLVGYQTSDIRLLWTITPNPPPPHPNTLSNPPPPVSDFAPPPVSPLISYLSHCHHTLEVYKWVVVSTLASETQPVLATPSMMVRAPPTPAHPTPPHPISLTRTDRGAHM